MNTDKDSHSVGLSVSESWSRLRGAPFGRLAIVVHGEPDILPVSHVVDRGSLVFRTGDGTKFRAAVGHHVAFEVDGYDAETGDAWSVVVKGTGHEITRMHDVVDALELPVVPMHQAPKPWFVRIEPETVTGRSFPQRVTTP
jgi:nitroimidazol reductase NimA-like FMN-containing flavoprotein (pyridoxamine 5'-phosphate oxidase superfamily)